jgi:hypothetical protein
MPKGMKNAAPVADSSDDDYWAEDNQFTVDYWRDEYNHDHSSSADTFDDNVEKVIIKEKKAKNDTTNGKSNAVSDRFELDDDDDDGFTILKGKKESEKEENQEQEQGASKKKKKQQQQSKRDLNLNQKSMDPLAGIDDPFDFFAQAQLQKVEKKAAEQRAEHQRKLRRERISLPTHKQPAKQSKAEKNQKLSNITRLVFGNSNKEQKKKKNNTSSEATNVQAAVERQLPPDTLEGVAKSLTEKDLESSIKKAETTYEKNPAFQLKDAAGWLEIQFSHINEKQVNMDENIKLFSDDFVKRIEKWLKTFDNKSLMEVCLVAIEEIYNDVGVEKAPGKHVGLKLFLQYIIRVQTKSVADALITLSEKFSFNGASYQNFKMLLDQIREHDFYVGLKTLISISLLRIMSKKIKEKDKKQVFHLLNTELENERVKNHSELSSSSTLVDPNLFVNFQKFAYENQADHIFALYKKLVPISIFWTDRSSSQFFAQELSMLKSSKISQDYRDEVLSILSRSLETDEKCVDLWIKSIPNHIKESTILLSYINQHGRVHKIKGSDKLVQSLNQFLKSSSMNEQLQELEKEMSTLVSTNRKSSIFGTLLRLIFFLMVLLVIVAIGTVLYCGQGGNEGNPFCHASVAWISFFTKGAQDGK